MIKLAELIDNIQFESPEDTSIDYYQDLNRIEKESGIHVYSWKHLSLLAIKNGKCVGALYEGIINNIFSFDVIVDKQERRQGIATKLIDITIANFKELPEEYKLEVQVVNAHLIPHLEKRGLKVIENRKGHIIMTF